VIAAAKAAALLFFVVIVQVTIVSSFGVFGGAPDLVLVTLAAIALMNGAIFGSVAGFWAGLLLDVSRLGTLGFTSLLLTLAGFWIGRYGETTARDRSQAIFIAVGVVTVLHALASLTMHFMLGDPTSARVTLVDALPAEILLNLILAVPTFALCRRIFMRRASSRAEVQFG
jgi:rod shape-determining protein MreD